ncbi:MAG: sulfurtransferase TusA family protein [Pseudomonadota bacterium]|uniref:sulfurtransferase TusA family protein n=1 Tax=Rhizorhabdus phycosphaerae TaxID=2711156 RepID=UPI0013ECAFDB|nr:sulfurtransferase TusA family protein [Rhizorhabdus phycosphaerae]
MTATRIDARGMRCPWPVVRLAKAVRDGASEVLILADDPIAPGEIAALAAARGWTVQPAEEDHGWHISVPAG